MRENRRRKREGRTYGRSLHFCPLLDLLVAFAIGWLSLATREADTSAGGEGWPPRRHEDGGGEVGKLRRGGWLTERVSQAGRDGGRATLPSTTTTTTTVGNAGGCREKTDATRSSTEKANGTESGRRKREFQRETKREKEEEAMVESDARTEETQLERERERERDREREGRREKEGRKREREKEEG